MQYKVSQSWMKSKRIPGSVRAAGMPPAVWPRRCPTGHHLRLAGWLSAAKPRKGINSADVSARNHLGAT